MMGNGIELAVPGEKHTRKRVSSAAILNAILILSVISDHY